MTRHADMSELAVGWALHALEPDDEARFLDHLPDCVECEALVAETVSTLSSLARADALTDDVEPPPGLRARILAEAVLDEPPTDPPWPLPPVPDLLAVPAVRPVPVSHAAAEPPEPVDRAPTSSRRGLGLHRVPSSGSRSRSRRARLLAVAAGVAVLAAVGGLVGVNQALRGERDQQSAAAAAADDSARVVAVLADAGRPGSVHATLASPDGAYLGLVVARDGVPTVLTTGVGANRPDQTYVLWGLRNAKAAPVALGVFDVGGSGPSVRSVPSASQAAPWAAYAVSLEPGRVAPASPTDIVAQGQVGT